MADSSTSVMVTDVWSAAALDYCGYPLCRLELKGLAGTEFFFTAPEEDAKIVLDDYEHEKLALANAKAYSLAFTRLTKKVQEMQRRGETSWRCDAYWSGVRQNVDARRREREQREREQERGRRVNTRG